MADILKNLQRRTERNWDAAVKSIARQHNADWRKLSLELGRAVAQLKSEIVEHIVNKTGLPAAQAKRRLKTFKPPPGRAKDLFEAFAGISVQRNSNIIHAGRVKGVRRARDGQITKIDKLPLRGPAFLLRHGKRGVKLPLTGERRRIYSLHEQAAAADDVPGNLSDDAISVNHPLTLTEVFKRFDRRAGQLAEQAISRAYR